MPTHRTGVERLRQRQDAVSCQVCRVKKLKCNRERPCSNCQTRNLTCEYRGEPPPAYAPVVITKNEDADLRVDNLALKARIQKLEQAVFGVQAAAALPTPSHTKGSPARSTPEEKAAGERAAIESQWLEGIGTRSVDVVPQFSDTLYVNIHTLDQLEYEAEHLSRRKFIALPTRDTAIAFLDSYAANLDSLQHVMHVPSTRHSIEQAYANITYQKPADPGAIALIPTICASVAFWDLQQGVTLSSSRAIQACTVLAREGLYAVEHARASSQITVETVQAAVLLFCLFFHMEGFSSRARLMHASSSTMARELGLHKIDAPRKKPLMKTQTAVVETEVGRKLWWYITSTDWFLGFVGGPNEGVYSIQPTHMKVDLPRNLNHDDLSVQSADYRRSKSQPTVMSYCLQRIKLAKVCREVLDAMQESFLLSDPERASYEIVPALDAKYSTLINDFPRFLQLDVPSTTLRAEFGSSYDGQMALQRAMINLMTYARRCKLHLPFLVRLKFDERYAFSRRVCLDSARKIFQAHQSFQNEHFSSYLKLGVAIHQVFYATVVMVMDLCVNNNSDNQQLVEVRNAMKTLEGMKGSSHIATEFLESLMEVLCKHQVNLSTAETSSTYPMYGVGDSIPKMQNLSVASGNVEGFEPIVAGEAKFEEIWQDYINDGSYLEPQNWDALVNDLEMRII